VDETFALLDGIGGDEPADLRDRALLELLYATGLRVGELTALDLADLDLAGGLVRAMGKGKKERIVPFGGKAKVALTRWLSASSPLRRPGRHAEAVFLSLRGTRLTRPERAPLCSIAAFRRRRWRRGCRLTRCGTRSPRTCWAREPTSGRSRSCSDTPRSRPPSATRTSASMRS
jgi:integrase